MRFALRDYQQTCVDQLRAAFRAGSRAPLLQLPTGGGKTVIFAHITEGAAAKGNRIIILVHRRELLMQASDALDSLGIAHGLISPDFKQTTDAVQVASVQTLVRRLHRVLAPDLLVLDEAHHAVAGMWLRIRQAFPQAKLLGVTATPARNDSQGLSDIFDSLICGPQVSELVKRGFLSKPVVYAPAVKVDMQTIRHRAGDFDAAATAALLDKASICGDVIQHYRRLCDGKPAIAFCATVAHAHHVAEAFRAAGFKAAGLDGTTEYAQRKQMIADLGAGRLNVLTSCDVVSEGTDIPAVFAAILLRPTESAGLYLQQVGRALRPYPGKQHALILDHVGNCLRHGLPDDEREWSLDGAGQGAVKKSQAGVARLKMCQACYAMCTVHVDKCAQCGAPFEPMREPPKQVDGELREITDEDREAMRRQQKREVAMARTREQLDAIARARGYKPGWSRFILRARGQRRETA